MSLISKRGLGAREAKGFTLIELLVVIAIIGILSSIVLASLNSARQKGRDARRVSDIKQLQLALELYYDSNPTLGYPTAIGFGATSPLVSGGFISTIPSDPSVTPVCTTGAEAGCYKYAALGTTCSSYHLGATLEITNNAALSSDADAAATTGICPGSATDFDGVAATVYDVKP